MSKEKTNYHTVHIKCLETGEVYESYADACRKLDVKLSTLYEACHNKNRKCGGCTWEILKKDEINLADFQYVNMDRIKPNTYMVDKTGNVYSKDINRMLHPNKNRKGYYRLCLMKSDGKRGTFFIHSLVANTYIPNPNNYPQINHKDEDKSNNCVENLEWCTNQYNSTYGGTYNKNINNLKVGIKKVKCLENGEIYSSAREASSKTGVKQTVIRSCALGLQNTGGGYHWEYIYE